jgi:hypothetical protein
MCVLMALNLSPVGGIGLCRHNNGSATDILKLNEDLLVMLANGCEDTVELHFSLC